MRPEEDLENDLKRREEDLENDLKRREEDLKGPRRIANLRTTKVMKTQVLRVSLGGRAVFPQPGLRIDRTASNGWQNDHRLFNFCHLTKR